MHGPGRPRHRAHRRGLFADVAGGRGAQALRMEIRHADRAAECLVPPAFQFRADAGALSRLQAFLAAQQSGRAAVVDQPPARRQPDRLCRREADGAPAVRRRAGQARPDAADGCRSTRPRLRTCRRRRRRPEANEQAARQKRRGFWCGRTAWARRYRPGRRAAGKSFRRWRSRWRFSPPASPRRRRASPSSRPMPAPDRTQKLIDGAKKENALNDLFVHDRRRHGRADHRVPGQIRHQGAALARQLRGHPQPHHP